MSNVTLTLIVFGCFTFVAGCQVSRTSSIPDKQVPEGDPVRGRANCRQRCSRLYGRPCDSRHSGSYGVVGPPLGGMATRSFIAGQLPNTPEMLVEFLQDPPSLVPRTGMPDVRVSLEEARHIAAYLYTLE